MAEHNLTAFLSGATAGLCVDIGLFPIDTLKTRLQSKQHGVRRASGSLHLFSGISATLIGSIPSAALFFLTYEFVKRQTHAHGWKPIHSTLLAASLAEITACVVRVPCEVFKQRSQNSPGTLLRRQIKETLRAEGFSGIYRGYLTTVSREIPFSLIQFPIWEQLRRWAAQCNQDASGPRSSDFASAHDLTFLQSALCGSLSGALAGAVTTPLDVAKTRIMLAEAKSTMASAGILHALSMIYREGGIPGLFAGVTARVGYLSLGGVLFFGTYDTASRFWSNMFIKDTI